MGNCKRTGKQQRIAPEVTRAERTNNEEEHSNNHLLPGRFSSDLLAVRLEIESYSMAAAVLAGACG